MEADNDNENLLYVVVFVQPETFSITSCFFVSEKFFGEKKAFKLLHQHFLQLSNQRTKNLLRKVCLKFFHRNLERKLKRVRSTSPGSDSVRE